ncbi:Rieske 2Fe-2S domain-containing protein [Methylobrevis albus]|uniref:Rieske 2Fe-2S domain-containing protein n=1 Tax=Methylobrevis albus TaxID=2793297 RepID=A0A931I1U2_9HYPH|nr:Rieske 2Fe-2S domain-containing protein [Methylobrevis albus]MBH0237706.1 Rieske 2Fe-2S domain-containing protein [Methylobrevis albus]
MSEAIPGAGWHPIASGSDLAYRHVFHGALAGREVAVWRADDDHVNVWENRCLHRGVKLSIGVNEGFELKCQYHGWRYANRTSACTYIPAHPADAPARTIANRTFPAAERYGLVWSGEAATGVPEIPGLADADAFPLRPLPVDAPAAFVAERLAAAAEAIGTGRAARRIGDLALAFTAGVPGSDDPVAITVLVQPLAAGRAVIRALRHGRPTADAELEVLRHWNGVLTALRDAIEAAAATLAPAAPDAAPIEPLPAELADLPPAAAFGRRPALTMRIAEKQPAGDGVALFRLEPRDGVLPGFQPGAHIDVHLPNGLVRQYSLLNGPAETTAYLIAVKREPQSRGGSAALHETLRVGDLVALSEPRNNFPLRRDAGATLFLAGGIGVTPLIAMAKTLALGGRPFAFHAFARDAARLPLGAELGRLGSAFRPQLGLDAEARSAAISGLLAGGSVGGTGGRHLYVCGPAGFIELVRAQAAAAGWAEAAVHFEYFANARPLDRSQGFELALSRSCLTLAVAPGETIVEAVRAAGVDIATSCEQGACGTCLATVLDGAPDHQDVYLTPSEKAAGRSIVTCVSRARSARLVLDL